MPTTDKPTRSWRGLLPLSSSDLEVLLRESNSAAARLIRQLRLPSFYKEDIRQELMVDLLGRISKFNPARGAFGAFAGTVVRHRASRVANQIQREKRFFVEVP